jgi:TRAP-type C4-dicarboxylate transport system permease small subunit
LRFTIFIFISALVIIVGAAAFSRYVLHQSLHWGTEAPNFLFMWIVFLGAAIAYRDKKHIAFDIFVKKLPSQLGTVAEMTSLLILTAFFGFLLVTGVKVVLLNMGSETEALKIPYGIVYASVPISSFLMLLESFREIGSKVRKNIVKRSPAENE